MTDRPAPQPDRTQAGNTAGDSTLEQVRKQILLHERHDRRQSVLDRAASFVLRTESTESLSELKSLYREAQDLQKSNDKERLSEVSKQLKDKLQSDRQALRWQDETTQYATGFAKTMGLFMKGNKGLTLTALSFGLDQICPSDSPGLQAADFTLGMGKGVLTRKVLGAAGSLKLGIAGEALTLGVSSRVIDQAMTRQNYFDSRGRFSLGTAFNNIDKTALDRTAIGSDLATFAGAHLLFGLAGRASHGALQRSPFLATALTGTTFGVSSGAASEIIRQNQSGQSFDLGKVLRHALVQGLVDTVAATPGGLQAHYMFRPKFSQQPSASLDRLTDSGCKPSMLDVKPAEGRVEQVSANGTDAHQTREVSTNGTNGHQGGELYLHGTDTHQGRDISTNGTGKHQGSDASANGTGTKERSNNGSHEPRRDVGKERSESPHPEPGGGANDSGAERLGVSKNGKARDAEVRHDGPATGTIEKTAGEVVTTGDTTALARETEAARLRQKPDATPVRPPDRSVLLQEGASAETVKKLTDPQVRLVLDMNEAVRTYFLDTVLRDPGTSVEALGRAIVEADAFGKKPYSEQVHESEKALRSLSQRLGLDSNRPLSQTEWIQLERAQDLFRTRLGLVLDQISRPDRPTGSTESTSDLQALFKGKINTLLDGLDIGEVKTLMGGTGQERQVLHEMQEAIERAGKEDTVRVVRLLGDHAADHCGFDFALVNTESGRLLPIDPSARNKFDNGLPEIRRRTVVTVPDANKPGLELLWTQIKQQQSIAASTPMPPLSEMLSLRCDYVLHQLNQSPLRITDLRLLFDEALDRQMFSRKISQSDRDEHARVGSRYGWLFQLSSGDLLDPSSSRKRTLSPGLSYSLGQASKTLRELKPVADTSLLNGQGADRNVAPRLETILRLIEMQTDSIGRFVHDLRQLSEKTRKSTGNTIAVGELEQYANHTENGALAYFLSERPGNPGEIAALIRRALKK